MLALETHLLSRGNRLTPCSRSSRGAGPARCRRTGSRASTSPRIQGSETVASMVVWQDGEMKKDDYKRYKIRTVTGTDDFASMHEVLTRRYGRALEGEGVLPDLVLLDGGRGQLGVGIKALEDLGLDYLPIASLAKRAEEVYLPDRLEPLVLDLGLAGAPGAPADPRRGASLRDHLSQEAAPAADHRLRARPDPRRGTDGAHEPAQDAGLRARRQGRLGGRARLGAEGHAEARQAHSRLLPSG